MTVQQNQGQLEPNILNCFLSVYFDNLLNCSRYSSKIKLYEIKSFMHPWGKVRKSIPSTVPYLDVSSPTYACTRGSG